MKGMHLNFFSLIGCYRREICFQTQELMNYRCGKKNHGPPLPRHQFHFIQNNSNDAEILWAHALATILKLFQFKRSPTMGLEALIF